MPAAGTAARLAARAVAAGRDRARGLIVIWYALAVWLNAPQVIDQLIAPDQTGPAQRPGRRRPGRWSGRCCRRRTRSRPSSGRRTVRHGASPASAASSTTPGSPLRRPCSASSSARCSASLLAVGIVHVRTLDRSLMPWIIASQTVPILAIAPMIIVVLGNIGFTGLMPKAIISAYLCFFPVTIGMVKGLRSPDPLQLDLMRTYSASQSAGALEAALAGLDAVPVRQPEGRRSPSAWSAPSSASCRRAPRPASARGCSPAPTTARRSRSGRRC